MQSYAIDAPVFLNFIYIYYLVQSSTLVYCQEVVLSNLENMKANVGGNVTASLSDISRIDRSHQNSDLESKFIIKSNLIIRTGESRALGAKYLNESKLSSNHECLMWCLETPSCNTAVYEERNMQSCYMFDCGSPAKPLCKFTAHNFFTSSVLKMSQHSYELSQWGRQVQQERSNTEHHNDVSTTTPTPVDMHLITTSSTIPTSNEQFAKKGSICHHYQFQCLNSSECIAIYNVCDGIPQCPDESDESPELKCPNKDDPKEVLNNKNKMVDNPSALGNKTPPVKPELPSVRPSAPFLGLQNVPSYKKMIDHKEMQHKNYKGMWPPPYSSQPLTKIGYHHHIEDSSDGLGSPFIHKHSQFISANDPHVQNLNQWASDYDQYPPHSTSLEQQYNPYDRMEEQYLSNQQSPDYEGGKNFAGYHQDDISYWPSQDILQDNSYTVDEFPQPGTQNLNKGIGYSDKENIYAQQIAGPIDNYPETKLNIHKPLLNQNQSPSVDDYKLRRYPYSREQQRYLNMEDSLPQHYYPEMKAKGYNPLQNADEALYNNNNNDDLIRASIVKQLPKKLDQINHPSEHESKHLDKDMLSPSFKEKNVAANTETSRDDSFITVKPTPHSKSIQRTVLDFKMSVAELYQSSSTHTHEANSAILALVLGVTVSFFLMILLACRMKTLRRRMSRKGRALAHDADYLVNGMYL